MQIKWVWLSRGRLVGQGLWRRPGWAWPGEVGGVDAAQLEPRAQRCWGMRRGHGWGQGHGGGQGDTGGGQGHGGGRDTEGVGGTRVVVRDMEGVGGTRVGVRDMDGVRDMEGVGGTRVGVRDTEGVGGTWGGQERWGPGAQWMQRGHGGCQGHPAGGHKGGGLHRGVWGGILTQPLPKGPPMVQRVPALSPLAPLFPELPPPPATLSPAQSSNGRPRHLILIQATRSRPCHHPRDPIVLSSSLRQTLSHQPTLSLPSHRSKPPTAGQKVPSLSPTQTSHRWPRCLVLVTGHAIP